MGKMNDLAIQGVTDLDSYAIGFENGVMYELLQIVDRVQKMVCFDHNVRGCDHVKCYVIAELISDIAQGETENESIVK